jgi:ABC-type sugar transport system ATPase subunit
MRGYEEKVDAAEKKVEATQSSLHTPVTGSGADALPFTVAPLIETRGICKSFGPVRALTDVDLSFLRGEVHGLVGANGAGKSTLLNIILGVVRPSRGSLFVEGAETTIRGPRDAASLGFSLIPQELSLVPGLSAVDNITLGLRAGSAHGFVNDRKRTEIAQAIAEQIGIGFDLRKPVRLLSVAERGLVAIGHALAQDARFVAMDEPTASLSDAECERLFEVIRILAKAGVSVAYVSHRLDEIQLLSDRVAVFRDGRVMERFERGAYSRENLVEGVTGVTNEVVALRSAPTRERFRQQEESRDVVFCARHLADGHRVKDVSFDCHAGEIVGLGGLVGSGRTETLKLAFGVARPVSGTMNLVGHAYHPASTGQAVNRGVALVPEERRSEGLVMDDTIFSNIVLGNWSATRRRLPLPLVNEGRARQIAASMLRSLDIKAHQTTAPVRTLSGGNQQKVVFGRWLARDSRLLLLDEPTRGVDVGARQQIWRTVEELARHDKAVVVVSSELGELAICERIFVMVEGRTVAELQGPGVSEDEILSLIYGLSAHKEA